MGKRILIGVLVPTLIAVLTISQPADAQLLKVSIGISQVNAIWQTSPHAFAEVTRWGGIGLVALFQRATVSAGITVVDFQSMRFQFPPSFYGEGDIAIAQLGDTTIFVGGGAVITPSENWIGWYLASGLTSSLMHYIDVSGAIGVETTKGARCCPSGMDIWIRLGISWSWLLFG
jgi:hypothetical protein